ncbi:hypothetical protein [Streptomyces triculaminicus]|uniref:hypothetical protein n=1 Tax=Streptomyces triculaminicus TaxID=2816232 RepID=UPI0037D0C3E0
MDGRPLYAKLSLLGLSLVSVLRGTAGDWAQVRAAQAAHQSSPGALLEREARDLAIFQEAGARACPVAGLHGGVLFTEPVTGPTPADLLAKDPHQTGELMTRAVVELGGLQRPAVAPVVDEAAITERGIGSTFDRKVQRHQRPDLPAQSRAGRKRAEHPLPEPVYFLSTDW